MDDVLLFGRGNMYAQDGRLAAALGSTAQAMLKHLQTWDPDDLLNTSAEDVIDRLADEGSVQCPSLLIDDAFLLEPTEVTEQYIDFGERRARRVTRFVLVVPFEGEKDVFTLRADQSSMNPPRVLRLKDHELHLYIDNPPDDPAKVKAIFDEQITKIDEHLSWSRRQIDLHNQQIRSEVPAVVAKRREQLLAARNLQAQIGYPIRRRPDADTYAVPMRRKTVRPQRQHPLGSRAPFKPEPAMLDQDYHDALRVLRNQRNALERTPSVAAKLAEEEIRDLLLVGLNAQFEGGAGGELFNGEGKTDITIRVEDRNIFIAECKVWHGPKTVDEALDQLFRYLVWRDTKAAILLFIRNKDVTAVINKAITKIKEHPNHKRSNLHQSDAEEYEFTMHAQDDPERDIHLTLIPFALRPTTETS
jgi:hypothetical protein